MANRKIKSEEMHAKKNDRGRSSKITLKRLDRVALSYIARYSSTKDSLRKILMRRVEASHRDYGTDLKLGAIWIEMLIRKFHKAGYLNDRNYAENRARALFARGKSTRAVVMQLRRKGVSLSDIGATLEVARNEFPDLDLYAAIVLARKRLLGPYRESKLQTNVLSKDLAIFARAGFNLTVARRVVGAKDEEELEMMLRQSTCDGDLLYSTDNE